MKRIISAILMLSLLILSLIACEKSENNESSAATDNEASAASNTMPIDNDYPTRTAAFYGMVQDSDFYFDMELTANGETYNFTQATTASRNIITTILDYDDNGKDSYTVAEITEAEVMVHVLDISQKRYDSEITPRYQEFLFGGQSPSAYSSPTSAGKQSFRDKNYYAEAFETTTGCDIYYFTDGKLEAVEILENDIAVMTMIFNDYSNEIPSDVYMSRPDDFTAGSMTFNSEIEYSDIASQWAFE